MKIIRVQEGYFKKDLEAQRYLELNTNVTVIISYLTYVAH